MHMPPLQWGGFQGKKGMAMKKEYWTFREVIETFEIHESFLEELMKEDIVCPEKKDTSAPEVFHCYEVEKLRIAKTLIEEMDVNLPGVEIILRMRQTMIDMRQQFDSILEDLVRTIHTTTKKGS